MAQGHFHQHHRRLVLQFRLVDELLQASLQHIECGLGHRPKTAPLDEHRLPIEHFRPLNGFPHGGEHRRLGQSVPHQFQRHQPIVHLRKCRTGKVDHVRFHPLPGQMIQKRTDEGPRVVVQVKGAIKQVHADNPERLLLPDVLLVQHPHVNENFRGLHPGLVLKADAHPAVAFFAPRRDCIGEHKKSGLGAALFIQSLQQQIIFIIEHGAQTLAADIAIGRPVNGVADSHVVSGDCLGHRAGRAAGPEKPPRDLLPGSDLRKSAIALRILVNALRLLPCIECLVGHRLIIHGNAGPGEWQLRDEWSD